jgi:spore coat protein A
MVNIQGEVMITRRTFLKYTAGGTMLTLFGFDKLTGISKVLAEIPGGTLDPKGVPKFITPLLIPPAMPRAGKITRKGGKNIDYYEIAVRQFEQQILPAGLPATTVWGYGPSAAQGGPAIFNAPSLTIEAKYNTPVRIKWINQLIDAGGDYLPHLLPVDPTLHWANPAGGESKRDTRPTFSTTPGAYQGPVPIVTHLHGVTGIGDESDGYAEAWFLPAAVNIPEDYAQHGTWYEFFAGKALANLGVEWGPGYATFQYPNINLASTLWYHDHTLGMTRLNVYAGPAGFYLVRGGPSDEVFDSRNVLKAMLPGPAPSIGDAPGLIYHEIPLAIQDRSFNEDGSLFYPESRAFFDEAASENPGYIPDTDLSPIWNPEFFGNMMMVNGNTWPYQTVEQRRYRFRFLNGCNSRFLILDFSNIPGVEVWMIGNEGGFLTAPVNLTSNNGNRLLMAPAERADVIVDFTQAPVGRYVLANVGPDEPFGGGILGVDFDQADSATTGQILEFRVTPLIGTDRTTPPRFLELPAIAPLPEPIRTRPLALLEEMSMHWDGPAAAMLGIVNGGNAQVSKMWADTVTENPSQGDTEIWELYNLTEDAHPIHVHEVLFEVVNREKLNLHPDDDEAAVSFELSGDVRPSELWETGRKDTVIAYPGEVTRIKARFNTAGQFVWHCHIVEHEDNEMMRPYRIGPVQPGQPV